MDDLFSSLIREEDKRTSELDIPTLVRRTILWVAAVLALLAEGGLVGF